jgi:hypothetical protein
MRAAAILSVRAPENILILARRKISLGGRLKPRASQPAAPTLTATRDSQPNDSPVALDEPTDSTEQTRKCPRLYGEPPEFGLLPERKLPLSPRKGRNLTLRNDRLPNKSTPGPNSRNQNRPHSILGALA